MTVEDLLTAYVQNPASAGTKLEDSMFLYSIFEQMSEGRTLSTRQGYAATATLRHYLPESEKYFKIPRAAAEAILNKNEWRAPLRATVEKRNEVRYMGDNLLGFTYAARHDLATQMRALKGCWRDHVLYVGVTAQNLEIIVEIMGQHRFGYDTAVEEYLALCLGSRKQTSHAVMVGRDVVFSICDSDGLAQYVLDVLGAERA